MKLPQPGADPSLLSLQPLTDQRPGYTAGQRGTSLKAAPPGAHLLGAAKGTQGLW